MFVQWYFDYDEKLTCYHLQIIEDSQATLSSYKPMGKGYSEIIPDVSDFSNPEMAFRQSIGKDRNIRVLQVQVRISFYSG